MSTMKDEAALNQALAQTLRQEREDRGWSLAELAQHSGVSRAMISKVERGEASPTAALLGRLVSAFGMTLSQLLATAEGGGPPGRLLRQAEQPTWQDPASGCQRRAVTMTDKAAELVEVALPPGTRIDYPAHSYLGRSHVLWVLHGTLSFHEGVSCHDLQAGDSLVLGEPVDCAFENRGDALCRYLVVLGRR